MFPAARMGDITASGDVITGPGAPTVLISGQPASAMGDLVSGAACVGAITLGFPTVLIQGRPASFLGSQVTGANPVTGVPVSTVVALGAPMVLIG